MRIKRTRIASDARRDHRNSHRSQFSFGSGTRSLLSGRVTEAAPRRPNPARLEHAIRLVLPPGCAVLPRARTVQDHASRPTRFWVGRIAHIGQIKLSSRPHGLLKFGSGDGQDDRHERADAIDQTRSSSTGILMSGVGEIGGNAPNEANFDETISIVLAQEWIQVTANSGALSGLDKAVAQRGEGTPREVAGAAADGRLCSVRRGGRLQFGMAGRGRSSRPTAKTVTAMGFLPNRPIARCFRFATAAKRSHL